MKRTLFCWLLAGCSPLASAQNLTLHSALEQAGVNSPAVQKAESARAESYWKKIESRSAFLPTISGNAVYLSDYKYMYTDLVFGGNPVSFPNIVPTTVYGLTAEYNVFDGFSSTNRLRSANAMERAAEHDLDWTRFNTELQVTLQFYRALAAKSLLQVSEANLKTLRDHLGDTTQLKRSGLSTNYDLLRVEVQVSEAQSEVMNANDEIATSNGRLAELLGNEDVAPPEGKLPEPRPDLTDRLESTSTARPDIQALSERVYGLQRQSAASDAHWMPKVNIFGTYSYYNNRNDDMGDWRNFRDSYQIGVNLRWNLFDGFSDIAKSRAAAEARVQADKSLRMAQLKAGQDVAFWKRKYKYFYSVFKARQSDISKAQESVRLAREGRRVGARTNTDLLDAETDLFRSQAGAIRAQLGVIEALINLELTSGKKIYEFN